MLLKNPKNHDILTIVCKKSVEIDFPLICSHLIFLDETAVCATFDFDIPKKRHAIVTYRRQYNKVKDCSSALCALFLKLSC